MSWSSIFGRCVLAGVVLGGAMAGPARGEPDDDDRLAKQLVTAAEKHSELREVTERYGRRAEIALAILERQQHQVDLRAEVGNMRTVIATYPQNRRHWLVEQWDYFNLKESRVRELNELERQLGQLRLEEKVIYEEELRKAREGGKRVRPLNREAMLGDLQRVERESNEAEAELKAGIEAAARERRATPRQILQAASGRMASLKTTSSPDADREFLRAFVRRAGGDSWLDGKKASSGRTKKKAAPSRKNRMRNDEAPF